MLVYIQVINCARLANHLMYTMQSQMAGVNINELPKFLAEDIYKMTHTIIVNDLLNPNEPLIVTLALKGVTSYFPYRSRRTSEYED